MNLKHFAQDERGVPPVIGVILMVAIVVILAAVIAAFVLGIGAEEDATPQITLDFEYDDNDDGTGDLTVTVQGTGTEGFTANEIAFRSVDDENLNDGPDGNNIEDGDTWADVTDGAYEAGDDISAGDSLTLEVDEEVELNVVWVADGDEEASILASFDGPEA